ncbi:MAG: TPM domain-containing protein [Sphingomonadales bacterium]|nr:TPM domain-containing protein [Sphingomonadales bacterium]
MINALRQIALALILLFAAAVPASAQTFPRFTGFVVDAADILPPDVEASLTQTLDRLQQDTKRQLIVATVPSLQGYTIEDYGYRLGRAWGVGLEDADNGAILLVAPNDRRVRVEVGRGLEPILTDALSSVTINQEILPRFRDGDMAGGVVAGTDAIVAQLRASPEEQQAKLDAAVKQFDQTRARRGGNRSNGGFPLSLAFWGMVVLFVLLSFARRGKGRRYRGDGGSGALPIILWSIANEIGREASRGGGGGSWGGGGGGGGWGGGGFTGGGGGSFGGGGASGSW